MTTQPTLILGYYADQIINTPELTKHYKIVRATAPVDPLHQSASLTANVNAVVAAINANPGPFALAGLSYGALVMANVYNEIRSGSLTSRRSDFMGAVSVGNPMREAGVVFPGAPDPGGHGAAGTRLVGTEALWWEFTRPGDNISCCFDDAGGLLEQAVYAWVYNNYAGSWDDVKAAVHAAFSGHPIQQLDSIFRALYSGLTWLYSNITWASYQPIPDDNRSVYKIATDYLTSLAPAFTATTVVTIDGSLGSQNMTRKLQGWATDQGTVIDPFYYPGWELWPDGSAFDTLVDSFNEKLVNIPAPGKIVLFAAGHGAVVVGSWLKRYGPTSAVGPDRMNVILIGNTARNYGGILRDTGVDLVPADTRYDVLDLKRQYDGWADWPDRSEVLDLVDLSFDNIVQTVAGVGTHAGLNAALGMVTIHPNYDDVNVPEDEFFEVTLGNITYRVYTTYPMPITLAQYPLSRFTPSFLSERDAAMRPMVELKYDRIEGTPKIEPLGGISTLEESDKLWQVAQDLKAAKEAQRLKPPQIRLWDGDGVFRGEVVGWRDIDFEIVENDTGTAALQLSLDHYLAKWVMNFQGRKKRNVLITIDKQGYRWSGFMDNYKVVNTRQNDRYITISFKHDYEQAKHILCWANPFLLPEVQFPKLWVIFGPAKWCLLVTLFCNILRLETSLWTLPDNPLDIKEWMPLSFDPSNWRNITKPFPFIGDNSNLTIVFSRFKSWHDTAKKDLQDAQLTVVCRRYIKGEDPHPFSDLAGELNLNVVEDLFSLIPLRHFCLVWDIVDKSGWGTETAFGGSLLTGLLRAVVNFTSDGITESVDIFTGDPTFPGEYYHPGFTGTNPRAPWVVYVDSLFTGISASEFNFFEATDTSFLVGGHSMPGVNEAFSAGINMAGDFLTSIINTLIGDVGAINIGGGFGGAVTASVPSIDLPPLGGIMDAVAKILYEDTFLAFMEVPTLRASPLGINLPVAGLEANPTSLGELHYYEGWADGADRAFTLSALMAVRAKWWSTRARTAHTITVSDAAPYVFGEKPYGDFGIGDRIGTTWQEYPIPFTIFMERVTRAKYGWGKDGSRGWTFTVGRIEPVDPAFKALEQIKEVNQALSTFGIL